MDNYFHRVKMAFELKAISRSEKQPFWGLTQNVKRYIVFHPYLGPRGSLGTSVGHAVLMLIQCILYIFDKLISLYPLIFKNIAYVGCLRKVFLLCHADRPNASARIYNALIRMIRNRSANTTFDPPSLFYRGNSKPVLDCLGKYLLVQIRIYLDAMWASTNVFCMEYRARQIWYFIWS